MAETLGYDIEKTISNPKNKIAIIAVTVVVVILLLAGTALIVTPEEENVKDERPKGSFAAGFEVSEEGYASKGVVQCDDEYIVNCLQVSMNVGECPPDCNYDPQVLTIKAGTTVEWANYDDNLHGATFADAGFSSPPLEPVEEDGSNYTASHWTYKFDEKGTFEYYDLKTPEIKGTIVVE